MIFKPSSPSLAYIRPVQLSDATGLHLTCWPYRSLEELTKRLQRAEKLKKSQRGLGVVAVQKKIICAFGMLTLWPYTAEISDLIVNVHYRNQGVGSQIINCLTSAAYKLHVQTLEIGVALSNPRALMLYRKLGFADHHTITIDLGHGPEPVLYLYKNIN